MIIQSPLEHEDHSERTPKDTQVNGSCGPMDKAPVYGTGDSRFDPWQDQLFVEFIFSFQGNYPYKVDVTQIHTHLNSRFQSLAGSAFC